jgi:hypothetical protein
MEEKIFADASEAASIKFDDGRPVIAALTLQEAVIAFAKLTAEEKAIARIDTVGGRSFNASDVENLHRK